MESQLLNESEVLDRKEKSYISDIRSLNLKQIRSSRGLPNKYFKKIYDNTIHNKKDKKSDIELDINFIEFNINYKTSIGYNVFMTGSCETLGNWNPYFSYCI